MVRVVRVVDGDTVVVQRGGESVRVRMGRIDAPERGQPGGLEATEALRAMLFATGGPDVRAAPDPDAAPALPEGGWVRMWQLPGSSYGREIGLLYTHLRGDVGAAMVRDGHAWAYDLYLRREGRPKVRDYYARLQAEARQAGRGLWGSDEPEPVAPWAWRRQRKLVKGLVCDTCGEREAVLQSKASGAQMCSRDCGQKL